MKPESGGNIRIVRAFLRGLPYALPHVRVHDVIRLTGTDCFRHAPGEFRSWVDGDGEAFPVVDLRAEVKSTGPGIGVTTAIVLVRIKQPGVLLPTEVIGLPVDGLQAGMLTGQLISNSPLPASPDWVGGYLETSDGIFPLIDVDRIPHRGAA
jgi:hypothetical protein